jgi:curved DNA-binding protein
MRDLYDVLGVSRTADARELKKAYRALAKKLHPDTSAEPDAEARFQEVSAAYDVLGDPERRALYDEFGEDALRQGFDAEQARAWRAAGGARGFDPSGFGGFGGFDPAGFQGGAAGFDFEDLLGGLFGGRAPRGATPRRAPDARAQVTLSFRDAALGARHTLDFGGGETLRVNLPAGVDDGEVLRLRGKGPQGPGGDRGDLLLTVRVRGDERFTRDGLDLTLDLPLTVGEAALGAKVRVPTLDGEVSVRVPAGARSGQRLRLKGKGIARKGKGEGDLYVRLQIHAPDATGREDVRRALETLERAYGEHPRASWGDAHAAAA